MKRTAEVTLGIIGIILSALTALVGMFFMWISDSEDLKSFVMEESLNDPAVNPDDIDLALSFILGAGWALIIAAILGIILGVIGVITVKGNNKPKLAGFMFIIGAILVGVISFGFGFLPALLYLIAGIMCFARKPVEPNPSDEHLENF
ncbi:DUF4064 domain-containing protein [Bacillus sp. FJAT-49732]|uniref:DUF4064 domain-containing protein n=1 Tax=Lederbergia citrisecunda TaxID=2833583 RepID=A0A942TJW9_9BACI|nr:DUF4064 domain-containing protein [Lederbergia citrisecunda]MBS4198848.1 DUF4064 domain-containing protein [Lederbergia citrisecunda]